MADQFGTPLKDLTCSFLTHTNIPMLISILEYEFCSELYVYIDLIKQQLEKNIIYKIIIKVLFVSFLYILCESVFGDCDVAALELSALEHAGLSSCAA